jgi:hypothetical protein
VTRSPAGLPTNMSRVVAAAMIASAFRLLGIVDIVMKSALQIQNRNGLMLQARSLSLRAQILSPWYHLNILYTATKYKVII